MLDIQKIMDALPHRYPFLLVDRIIEMEEGKRIVSIKNVTMNEPLISDHAGSPLD
jgi:3-hydroxyacyl-[acyl-carrier-protein] dehydratase